MADTPLSAFLQAVMQKATDHVLQQSGVMWGMQGMLDKLERVLSGIQGVLGDAEQRQFKEKGVKSWMLALKNTAYEADNILDEFDVEAMRWRVEVQIDMSKKVRSFFSLHNPVCFRFKMARKLKHMIEKLDEIEAEGVKFHFTVTTQKENRPQTCSDVIESDVIGREGGKKKIEVFGRENEKEKIVKLLLDHDNNHNVAVLPILGVGGLGKTTLAQLIYRDEDVKKHFQLLIWVCVSDEFDVAKLAKAIIASATGIEYQESNMELLQGRLQEVFSGKRYLLVLDDVWNEDQQKWDELKDLLGTGGEGSRIIVTTRSVRASSIMGTFATFHLLYLNDDDSWTLFRKTAFEEGAEVPPTLEKIGKEIVKKCGGLPLAVKTLGSIMHSKGEEREWLFVRDSEIWDLQVSEDGILPALWLSYSHLPFHLKQCFAFCAIFPRDYEMEKDLLIQLWMANGFIPSDGRKELEDKGHEIFNELAARCFFQDIKKAEYSVGTSMRELHHITTCKMHDLMHDLALSIMGNECLSIVNLTMLEDLSRKTRHLFTSYDVPLNNYPNICTLLSSATMTVDSSKPRSLRALGLHHYNIRQLPISIGFLKHLRYLDLSSTSIEALPDATNTLLKLQTLKLSNCQNLRKLPEDIRLMSSLRHLYIDKCCRLKHLPAGIGKLSNLRTLTKYIVGNDAERRIGELKSLNLGGLLELYNLKNVRDAADAKEANLTSKHNICSLILCWDIIEWNAPNCYAESAPYDCEDVLPAKNAEEVLEALRPYGSLKLLAIWCYGGHSFPTWMDSLLLQNLVEIHLGVCTGCEHLPPLWQLPLLKSLYLIKMDSIKHICSNTIYGNVSNGTIQAFPSLKRLVLHTMQSLEKWSEYEGIAEVMLVFPHLVELKIIGCPNLMTMPDLPSLKSLEMEGTDKQLGLVCSLTTLSSLDIKFYKMSNGPELPSRPLKKISFRYFRSLENLTITAEDLAPLLLEEEGTRGLSSSLHHLCFRKCNWLFSSSQQLSSPFGFWKNLTSLLSLEMYYIDDLVYWPVEFRGLNSLKRLSIWNCNKFVGPSSLPLSSSSSSGDGELLPNLEELNIVHCDSLLELPNLPASLISLRVSHCSKLNSMTSGLRQATNLTRMSLEDLPGLTCLPLGFGQLTALKYLDINNCSNLAYLPEGMQGLIALQHLYIARCPRLSSLPEGLQRLLPYLQSLVIKGCPDLERQYRKGGQYWDLISCIPDTDILSQRRSTICTACPSFSCFGRQSTSLMSSESSLAMSDEQQISLQDEQRVSMVQQFSC